MAPLPSQTTGQGIKPLAEIPTLTNIYSSASMLQALEPDDDDDNENWVFPPSAAINSRVGLVHGDITKLRLDAIVNAANQSLLGGGGVDGAIHRAAGNQLREECKKLNGCATGQAKLTLGYSLPAAHVIHTVGPMYDAEDAESCEEALHNCYHNSLELAAQSGIKTIAFSAISTGIYGYPSRDAAQIACDTVREFLEQDNGSLRLVVFVTFADQDVAAYDEMLPIYFPPVM
ncbi:hypothetical protein CDD81_5520 [Ophiocordyceps australis]|uniref:Macro domain-containing protein n=1 Tax=Ophiocordyceps australis TaxID=1399860 RepID=A0A2C5Y2P1_9HYPO|nr:hypothetical protein CDD81_5520 [Ophiocordyceps australis]